MSLVWFRSDLRVTDNPALSNALRISAFSRPSLPVYGIYILCPNDEIRHDRSVVQMDFILRALKSLSRSLKKRFKIPLLVCLKNGRKSEADIFSELTDKFNLRHLFFNKQYEVDEMERDVIVTQLMRKKECSVHSFDDQIILPPRTIDEEVASKFYKKWLDYVRKNPEYLNCVTNPEFQNPVFPVIEDAYLKVPDTIKGFELDIERRSLMEDLYPASESHAHQILERFLKSSSGVIRYADERDYLDKRCSSRLSPYLSSGIISVKSCFKSMMDNFGSYPLVETNLDGPKFWIRHLIIREFFKNILINHPKVCKNKSYKPSADLIQWRYDEAEFKAWCDGKTGYPIVDASMRELNFTGWISNRSRQIVASFLTKYLLHDWRLGEKFFMHKLIDGDLSANNGGWQWVASTGTDARFEVRIFNPYLQTRKFDPKGEYIKKWVPELQSCEYDELSDPTRLPEQRAAELGYCKRIVEFDIVKSRVLQAFGKLK